MEYKLIETTPKKLAKAAVAQAKSTSALNRYTDEFEIRAVPLMKYSKDGEVVHPERVKIEFYVPPKGDEPELKLSDGKFQLPLSVLFGLYGPGGNHTDTYTGGAHSKRLSTNPFALTETVNTSEFGSKHKYIYSFGPLPVPKRDDWNGQHDDFYVKLQRKVNELIVSLVKQRVKLGKDKDPIKVTYPQMLLDLIPESADPVGTLLKLNRLFYPTVKPVNKNTEDGHVKIGHTEYATSKDWSKSQKASQDLVLPPQLEPLRGDYEREKCVPKNQNIRAYIERKKRKRDDSDDEYDSEEDQKPKMELHVVQLNPVAQTATVEELTKRANTIEKHMLNNTVVARTTFKDSSTSGFTILFSETTVKFYMPAFEIMILAVLPHKDEAEADMEADDEVADALLQDSDEE